MQRNDEFTESGQVRSHCSSPHDPVGLGISLTTVQRQTINILLRQIIRYLHFCNFCVKDVQSEQFIPDKVVLLAPGTRLVKGQTIMVAVVGHTFPLSRHLTGLRCIAFGNILLAEHFGQPAIRGHP